MVEITSRILPELIKQRRSVLKQLEEIKESKAFQEGRLYAIEEMIEKIESRKEKDES